MTFPRYELASGYSISRVIKGHWQLSEGHLRHGGLERSALLDDMRRFVEAGITTFDVADIYTGAEELIGDFIRAHKTSFANGSLPQVQVHTKYVPDLNLLATVSKKDTAAIIERSLMRLGVDTLDLVQYHWWDYEVPRYVEVAQHLIDLQKEGKIRHLGVTNFNTPILSELVAGGMKIVGMQTQYSVLDRRPEKAMVDFCRKHDISLLCYGTLAGGFLSSKFLGQPDIFTDLQNLKNRSQTKYRMIIEDIGGWDRFQALLRTLAAVGEKHGVDISEVATAYILTKQTVGAAIVGAYSAAHLEKLVQLQKLQLTPADIQLIEGVLANLTSLDGDPFDLERTSSRHRGVMKLNLNSASG